MKRKLALFTTLGLLMPMLLPQAVCADYDTSDLERLHWLCSDYQLQVKGYVVEGWFALFNRPGLQETLEQQLQLPEGQQQGTLMDGSTVSTSLLRNGDKLYVELQLLTTNLETARHYDALWQSFADCYADKKPVGITVIAELPERLDDSAMAMLAGELQQSLQLNGTSAVTLERMQQISGYSPQLQHHLEIGGQPINFNLAMVRQESKTAVYLATPIIYQQY